MVTCISSPCRLKGSARALPQVRGRLRGAMRHCLTHCVAAGPPLQSCFGKWLHTILIAHGSSNEKLKWLLLFVVIMFWDFLVPSIASIPQILTVALRMFPAFEHTNGDIRENQNIQQVWRFICGRRSSNLGMSDIYTPSQLSIKDVLVPFESREQMLTFALSWFIRGFRDALPRTEHEWMDYGRLWAPLFHSFRIVVFLYCSLTAMEKMGIHGMQMGACFQQNQTPLEGARRKLKTAMGKHSANSLSTSSCVQLIHSRVLGIPALGMLPGFSHELTTYACHSRSCRMLLLRQCYIVWVLVCNVFGGQGAGTYAGPYGIQA